VSLLTELDAFFTEHQRCGDLDAGVEGAVVWMACDCGANMARRVDVDDRAGGARDRHSAWPEVAVAAGRGRRRASGAPRLRQGETRRSAEAPLAVLKATLNCKTLDGRRISVRS
jgi:hypothetical protein